VEDLVKATPRIALTQAPPSRMHFDAVGKSGACLVQVPVHADERGSFRRTWCEAAFADAGIEFRPVQGNSSYSRQRGTVRGMHFQRQPFADAKIVRVARGTVWDIIVDLRPASPDFGIAQPRVLSEEAGTMLFVPRGFAHGFQTLTDEVIVEYLMGVAYEPTAYDGFRYDDPALALEWPEPVTAISTGDLGWPPLTGRIPGFDGAPA
jgi:dTDP-4-dehydrorhamnose 3,5-epimerase